MPVGDDERFARSALRSGSVAGQWRWNRGNFISRSIQIGQQVGGAEVKQAAEDGDTQLPAEGEQPVRATPRHMGPLVEIVQSFTVPQTAMDQKLGRSESG